ncbi:YdcF family protein [Coleofasciculus sp. LEGE 07092]|nr:YdcF family protein [Coleofasciculus sp. LEGE 07081]MBE9151242.1 YdcF family protein [Coleofasciculus sp. LEGE 07092]
MIVTVTHIYPFLAVSSPIEADVMVVEGWLPDYAIKKAIAKFNRGSYRQLIATGLPLDKGYYLAQYKNSAEITAATLIAFGFNKEQVVAVPSANVIKYRTQAMAIAVREWLLTSDLNVKTINLYTMGPHARRSWIIFKAVLAPEIQVGVIAAKPWEYNPNRWWKYSEGVRTVIGETIAYVYARFVDWSS